MQTLPQHRQLNQSQGETFYFGQSNTPSVNLQLYQLIYNLSNRNWNTVILHNEVFTQSEHYQQLNTQRYSPYID